MCFGRHKRLSVFETFSKRQKRLRGENPDIYRYDAMPEQLRVQIVHIWHYALGDGEAFQDRFGANVRQAYRFIVETLRREFGVFGLVDPGNQQPRHHLEELVRFLLLERDVERVLDAIEVSFRVINGFTRRPGYFVRGDPSDRADEAIDELTDGVAGGG